MDRLNGTKSKKKNRFSKNHGLFLKKERVADLVT